MDSVALDVVERPWLRHNGWTAPPLEERFWQKVDKSSGPDSCWHWIANIDRGGYGLFSRGRGRSIGAHRMAYLLVKGEIPPGMQVDHVCHVPSECVAVPCLHRRCVNPAHLATATPRQNSLRSNSIPAKNATQTHCLRGHPLSGDNLSIDKTHGYRICKACKALHFRNNYVPHSRTWPERTHCARGHELKPENTITGGGKRCRICKNQKQRERRHNGK